MASSSLLLALALALSVASICAQGLPPNATAVDGLEERGLDSYGLWCGAGHGGFQDCCQGTGCPACLEGLKASPMELTEECLLQCPPIDLVDLACSRHDLCTFRFDVGAITGDPNKCAGLLAGANYCGCDCQLVEDWKRSPCEPDSASYSSAACAAYKVLGSDYFNDVASCFYIDQQYNVVCDHQYSLDQFC